MVVMHLRVRLSLTKVENEPHKCWTFKLNRNTISMRRYNLAECFLNNCGMLARLENRNDDEKPANPMLAVVSIR